MKKFLPIILIFIILGIYGCGSSSSNSSSAGLVDNEAIKVTGITAAPLYIELDIANNSTNKTAQIQAAVEPADADNKTILYASDNENIAAVDMNGLVTAKSVGIANITVFSAANPSIFKTAAVLVLNSDTGEKPDVNKVLAIQVDTFPINLDLNTNAGKSTFQINAVALPADLDTAYSKLLYSSSNSSIAFVDDTGLVTAKSAGNAVITITAETNSALKEVIEVNISDTTGTEPVVESIYLSDNKAELDLNIDKLNNTYQINAVVLPENLDESKKLLIYSSDNNTIAEVDTNGLITAKSIGNAVITITSESNPAIQAVFNVQVADTTGKTIPVTDINVLTAKINLDLTDKLTDTILTEVVPDNADNKALKFTVEPATLAAVNSIGFITARNTGEGTITIQSESNPDIKKTIPLNITNSAAENGQVVPITALGFEETGLILKVGESYQLTPKFTPVNTTQRNYFYDMSGYYDQFIDFDRQTGLITAKAVGIAWPEIKSYDTSSLPKAEIRVQVVDANGPIELTGLTVAPKTLTVNKDQYLGYFGQHISINYEPSNTSEKSVKFISNNPALLTINESTGIARAANTTGTVTVKVQSVEKPEIYDELTVNIIDPYDKEPPVYNDINPSEMAANPDRMYIKIMFDVTSSTGDIYNDNEKVGIRGIDYTFMENNNSSGTLLEEPANGYIAPYGFCEKYGCFAGRFENISIAQKNAGITYYVGNNGIYTNIKTSGITNHDLYLVFFTTAGSYYSRHTVTLPIDWKKYDASIHKNAAKFHIIINDKKASVVFDGFENR